MASTDATDDKRLNYETAKLGLSARAHDKILRVSRTIAETIAYRSLDRDLWI